jgi:Holliday junction DNA helicase RuvB
MSDKPFRRITSPVAMQEEKTDFTLRPRMFEEYVGQKAVKDNLIVFAQAAKQRKEALDHILFCGPPGLGKTTLAYIIANELGVDIKTTSGPAVEKKGDLAGILTNLKDRDILFIDEIHRLNAIVEENLYPAMEDFKFDIVIGEGPKAKSVKLSLARFTLIGATTRTGLLTSPLRNRFGIVNRLDYYPVSDILKIVLRSAKILNITCDEEGAYEIARRSRGTPRVANRLLKRVRDFAQILADGRINVETAVEALNRLDVDSAGFDSFDRKYLLSIIEKYSGGPVGIETLSASLSEEKDTIEEVYEPFLLQEGYIQRTPRGRMATPRAYAHFNIKPAGAQGELL